MDTILRPELERTSSRRRRPVPLHHLVYIGCRRYCIQSGDINQLLITVIIIQGAQVMTHKSIMHNSFFFVIGHIINLILLFTLLNIFINTVYYVFIWDSAVYRCDRKCFSQSETTGALQTWFSPPPGYVLIPVGV